MKVDVPVDIVCSVMIYKIVVFRWNAYVFRLSVCLTLVHPAKAVERNEMPLGRDTRVASSIRRQRGPQSPHGKGRLGQNP